MATGSQLGSAASGAASGAVAGSYFGPYGAAAGAVIGGVAGYFSGDDGSNAEMSAKYAAYNAYSTLSAGMANANRQWQVAQANSELTMAAARFNVDIGAQVSTVNADIKSFLGDYNASLLEDESRRVWDSANLSLEQGRQQYERNMGQIKVTQGASGVLMNQDTALQVQIDAATQHEMDVMVVRHNADVQSGKLLDAAARSRWEGNMAASEIMFQGKMSAMSQYGNALLSAAGQQIQGKSNSDMTWYNSQVNARQILNGSSQAQSNYQSSDNQALASGLFSAASKTASAYGSGRLGGNTTSANYSEPSSTLYTPSTSSSALYS